MGARAASLVLVCLLTATVGVRSAPPQQAPSADPPAIDVFPSHQAVLDGRASVASIVDQGKRLFRTVFNTVDGAGRPNATGDSKPTLRSLADGAFHRVAGPDASSCADCHNAPEIGGSGGFATNVFVGAHFSDPVTLSSASATTNERNTTSVFGAAAIEVVAREMTEELRAQRQEATWRAQQTREDVRCRLSAKSVDFGSIVVHADGTFETTDLEGVDMDLVVKPFGVKGVAVSLREFTNFALNQHHGIQSDERFGWARTGIRDFDGDGVATEMTVGQVSALALYQASLPPPRRVYPRSPEDRRIVEHGEAVFSTIGCATCHRAALPLRSAWFLEPNPYNRPGSAVPADVGGQVALPFQTEDGTGVYRDDKGRVFVAAFTDLKRHVICDAEDRFYCNEELKQDFVPVDQFLTTKLWDAGTSAPYGHRGDLTTLTEAIEHHSGEARAVRRAFSALPLDERRAVVQFLRSLQGGGAGDARESK